MKIIVLDHPGPHDECSSYSELGTLQALQIYSSTSLDEFLTRAQNAEAIVSFGFPLRRELLDYATRPRWIFVPSDRRSELVELPIAEQLGIPVVGITPLSVDPCRWFDEVRKTLDVSE